MSSSRSSVTLEKFLTERDLNGRGRAEIVGGTRPLAKGRRTRRFRNVRYVDIGTFLRDATKKYFKRTGPEITIKSIDPSYTIGGIQQIAMTQPSACSWDTAQFMLE